MDATAIEIPGRDADGTPTGVAAPVRTVRVLTINIHKGFTALNRRFVLPELREAIRTVGADVVFLQEVHGEESRHALRWLNWPSAPHHEFLADTMWAAHAYGRNAVYPHGHHGNAVLSKYPIVRWSNHDVSIGDIEPRGLLHCVIDVPGLADGLHAVCVHLGLRETQRRQQLDSLCRMVADEVPAGAPLVVAGDFNDWRGRAKAPLASCAGLVDVYAGRRGRGARTFPARLPLLALDRIYVRNAVPEPVALPRRPWSHLSDHVPLAAEMRIG